MPLIVQPSPSLLAGLRTAAAGSRWVHHIDCATYDEDQDGVPGACTCGIPDLIEGLAMLLVPRLVAPAPTGGRSRHAS